MVTAGWMILAVLAGSAAIAGLRLLTLPATLIAAVMALLLLFAGGWSWLTPALGFLVLAALWTRWPGASRSTDRTRRARQVLANGLVPLLASAFVLAGLDPTLGAAWIAGSYAAAAADTWGTEWGGAFGGRPWDLRTLTRVEPGQSGAISLVGTVAGVAGATSIAGLSAWTGMIPSTWLPAVTAAGVAGSLLDSIVGAWAQAVWRRADGSISETRGDEAPAPPERGIAWIDNDVVNLAATLTGALLAGWWTAS